MQEYDFYKTIRVSNPKVKDSNSSLHNLYDQIPSTKGCLENKDKNECCGAWCCQIQTPQLFYCEFLLIWDHISKEMGDDDLCELFKKCMLNAVNKSPSKGCVFFNKEDGLCTIHDVRPCNCRIYGITPEEEFNKRYKEIEKEYSIIPGAVCKPQCSLVSTEDGKEVTSEDTEGWWKQLTALEHSLGIPDEYINDEVGGSYRSPHDHILLYNMPENVLSGLAGIRLYARYIEQVMAVGEIINNIKRHFKDGKKNNKSVR